MNGRTGRLLPTFAIVSTLLLGACGTQPPATPSSRHEPEQRDYFTLNDQGYAQEMVIYALGLLGTGYRFGGRNPEAGLDCSGMVSYIVEQVSGRKLPHNAAQIAYRTRPIQVAELQPGDLVFFNTSNRPHSHMGIYMGKRQFVHAPSSRGVVRITSLDNTYFKSRIDGARRLVAMK